MAPVGEVTGLTEARGSPPVGLLLVQVKGGSETDGANPGEQRSRVAHRFPESLGSSSEVEACVFAGVHRILPLAGQPLEIGLARKDGCKKGMDALRTGGLGHGCTK